MGRLGVDEHLQVFVLSQVEVGGLVDGATIAVDEVLHGHLKCLLVDADGLCHSDDTFLLNAGRGDIRHGNAAVVLVNADGRDIKSGLVADIVGFILARGLDALRIGAPFAFYEVEGGETQHDRTLEFGQEHTHEADAGVVVDAANDAVGLPDGDAELIPSDTADLSVRQGHAT